MGNTQLNKGIGYGETYKIEEEPNAVTNQSLSPLFQAIWQTKAPPKIRHFIWRYLSNCVATGINMKKRKLTLGGGCPRCPDAEEDINHILFSCSYARLVSVLSPACHLFFPQALNSTYENLSNHLLAPAELRNEEDTKRLIIWPWILWQFWKSRNDIIFSALDGPTNELVEDAKTESQPWFDCNSEVEGFLKCNTNSSWSKDKDSCGIGWILRNHQGQVIHLGEKCMSRIISPIHVEATSLVWAVKCVTNLSYRRIIFEYDSSNLIQAITLPQSWSSLHSYTTDILGMSNGIDDFSFRYSNRHCNYCAKAIANAVVSECVYFATLLVLPPILLQVFVDKDVCGLASSNLS